MKIEVETKGFKELEKFLGNLTKQVPFAAATALNKTARSIKKALAVEMEKTFDRPTPFIKNAVYTDPASKKDLKAAIGIKDDAQRILAPHVHGGKRSMKRSEKLLNHYWTPGRGARLNKYGNIS